MFGKNLDIIFLVFSVLVIVILLAVPFQAEEKIPEEPEKPECYGNQTRDCMKGPCEGTQTCTNGEWGKCKVKVICTPGTKTPCVSNHCSSAYKVCNDCGTGYGECIGLNQS